MGTQTASRTRVFLTGAAGNWGRKVLDEFRAHADEFDVVALVLPSPKDLAVIHQYEDMENLHVVFGDLTDYPTVESCVRGADFVLHIGAVVSPFADDHPALAHAVNVGSMHNIIRAVAAQPDPGAIGVVGVGSIAETGDRNPPHHWSRIGDPLQVARYDEYGQSKIIAEKELVDSGLPKWAWVRQTGIFHPGMLEIRDPIMTHSPFEGVMEWVSVEDAARLMVNICGPDVPEEFWGGLYNIGGGDGWRLTNWELQTQMTAALGVTDVRKWYDRNWFATRNFHGSWYTDSDRLEELVPFRRDTFDDALRRAITANPGLKIAGKIPAWVVKNLVLKPLTLKPRGTMGFVRDGDDEKLTAYFGSRADWEQIGDWTTFWPPRPDREPSYLDHGYDETKPPTQWSALDYIEAASFRGGELLTADVTRGDTTTPLTWRCGFGHEFTGSPRLILTAGHWCPDCVKDTAGYPEQAHRNRFLGQLRTSPVSKGRNKKAQRRGKSLGPVRRTAGLPAASIDPQSVPADPERQMGYGATVMLGGVVDPPGITYFDDRVEAVLTKRGWTSARSDGNVPDGDAWAFDTRGGDYLAASRAYIYVTRDHIVADAAEESGIPSRRYNSVEELEADLDEIEAWPHEDDLAPR